MENNNSFQPQPLPPQPQPVVQFPQPSPPKRKFPVKLVTIIAASLLVVAGIVIGILLLMSMSGRSDAERDVKATLVSVATAYSISTKNGDGYPTEISAPSASSNVRLFGGGSVDGQTYCVTGVSTKDSSVVYHVSSKNETPEKGSCATSNEGLTLSSPGMPSVATASTEAIKFTWAAVPGASAYTLQCATNKDFSKDIVEVKVTDASGECAGLKGGTDYFARVKAGDGSWSQIATASTNKVSVAPTKLTLKATSANSVSYSWQPVSGASSYVLEWATDVNFVKGRQSLTVTTTSGTISELTPNTVYWYHVKAVTADQSAGQATFSPEVQVKTSR